MYTRGLDSSDHHCSQLEMELIFCGDDSMNKQGEVIIRVLSQRLAENHKDALYSNTQYCFPSDKEIQHFSINVSKGKFKGTSGPK